VTTTYIKDKVDFLVKNGYLKDVSSSVDVEARSFLNNQYSIFIKYGI